MSLSFIHKAKQEGPEDELFKVLVELWFNPFDTFGSTALPIGTHLNYHWEQCAPINTTLTSEHLVIQNGFVGQHMK